MSVLLSSAQWSLILKTTTKGDDPDQLMVQGPMFDQGDSVLTIAGGTGYYSGAQGTLLLKARATADLQYDLLLCVWL